MLPVLFSLQIGHGFHSDKIIKIFNKYIRIIVSERFLDHFSIEITMYFNIGYYEEKYVWNYSKSKWFLMKQLNSDQLKMNNIF